jgi:hypothetical protein
MTIYNRKGPFEFRDANFSECNQGSYSAVLGYWDSGTRAVQIASLFVTVMSCSGPNGFDIWYANGT